MRQIIKNGTIVTGSGSFPADILIDGEKIAATGTAEEIKKLAQPGDKEIIFHRIWINKALFLSFH